MILKPITTITHRSRVRFTPFRDAEGRYCFRDQKERIEFENSRYVPGNGAEHRLGRAKTKRTLWGVQRG